MFADAQNADEEVLRDQGFEDVSFVKKVWHSIRRRAGYDRWSTENLSATSSSSDARPASSVFRLLVVGFALITIVPTTILAWEVYNGAWNNAWREVGEKHQLLATTLASPISIYIDDHRDILGHLAVEIAALESQSNSRTRKERLLNSAFATLRGFRSLVVVDASGKTEILAHHEQYSGTDEYVFKDETCFLQAARLARPAVSNLKSSPLTGLPSIIISHPVVARSGKTTSVVLAEIRLDRIEELRNAIAFGDSGHSAIIDATGKVLAHGNKEWVREMKDSRWSPDTRPCRISAGAFWCRSPSPRSRHRSGRWFQNTFSGLWFAPYLQCSSRSPSHDGLPRRLTSLLPPQRC